MRVLRLVLIAMVGLIVLGGNCNKDDKDAVEGPKTVTESAEVSGCELRFAFPGSFIGGWDCEEVTVERVTFVVDVQGDDYPSAARFQAPYLGAPETVDIAETRSSSGRWSVTYDAAPVASVDQNPCGDWSLEVVMASCAENVIGAELQLGIRGR